MTNKLKYYKYLFLIITIGSLLTVLLNFILQLHSQTFLFPDAQSYIYASENLYEAFSPHPFRPILIAFFYGMPFVFGYTKEALPDWTVLLNIIVWLCTLILLFKFVSKFVVPRAAFLLTLLYLFTLGSIVINFNILSEPVYTLFLFSSVYLFQKYFESLKFIFLSAGLSMLLLSLMIKPASNLLIIVIILYFSRQLLRNIINKWSVLLLGSFLIICLHVYGMHKKYGNYTITYIDGITLYDYLSARAVSLKEGTVFKEVSKQRGEYIFSLPFNKQKEVAITDFRKQLNTNSANLLKAYFQNLYTNSFGGNAGIYKIVNKHGTSYFDGAKSFAWAVSRIQNVLYTIAGLVLSIFFLLKIKNRHKVMPVISLYILSVFFLSGISSDQGDRFHMVFFPQVIVLFAVFISIIWPKRFSVQPQI